MIHYHGLPITPDTVAVEAIKGGHAFVSFAHPGQLGLAIAAAQSFALDNGAFSAWMSGQPVTDWSAYYAWVQGVARHAACDFAIIPDCIDGGEADNDALLAEWPHGKYLGVPVWHLHESLERLERLAADYPRIALGSSGEFASVGTPRWWNRMAEVMRVLCDDEGYPLVRIHGLRMLNPDVFGRLPFASADSTNIGRNVGIDSHWKGTYTPPTKAARAALMRARIESVNAPARWVHQPVQEDIACLF